jgi:hypothetical protein
LHYSLGVFPSCFFPSLVDDIHIFSFVHVVSFVFDYFASQLATTRLFIQICKCSTWVLFGLPPGFVAPIEFCCSLGDMKIVGVPFGFVYFAFSFLPKVLSKDVWHVDVFSRSVVHVAFGIPMFRLIFFYFFYFLLHYSPPPLLPGFWS